MQLDLVQGGSHVGLVGEPLEMLDLEVGHADRTHPAVGEESLEGPPGLDILIEHRQWPVDQEEIEDLDAQSLHAVLERGQRPVVSVAPVGEFGGDEDLLTGHLRTCDGFADTLFVPIPLSSVDEPVTGVECGCDRRCGLVGWDEKHTEAELGDRDPVVER